MDDKKCLLIIDSNSLLHRAFHALPPLTTKKGEQTGAIYGFLLILFKAIKDINPLYVVACFDLPVPTFRHKKFEGYKAKRPKTPEEIKKQLPKIKEVLRAFGIPIFEKEGFEADDLIATISTKAGEENNQIERYILSGDLDNLQLVDERTKVYTLGRGIKETIVYDKEKVVSRFEVLPEQMIDFKALTGDASDNIPGVPGIGKKTAAEIIKKFNTLEDLYQKIEKSDADISQRTREILIKNKKQAFLCRFLAEMKKDVAIDFNIKEARFGGFDQKKIEGILNEFEFYSLVKRIPEICRSIEPVKYNLKLLGL